MLITSLPPNAFWSPPLGYTWLKVDLPTGATMVGTFGIALILLAAVRGLLKKPAAAGVLATSPLSSN
jgi:hypothetical protein